MQPLRRGGDLHVAEHRAALLREACHVEHRDALALEMRGHAEDAADRHHAGAADAGHDDAVGPFQRRQRRQGQGVQIDRVRLSTRRSGGRGLAHLRTLGRHEARTEAVQAREVLVARRLVDLALGAELGFQRFDRQAVRLHRAVAAAFADRVVDEGAPRRIGIVAALAAAALFGRAGLVVDQHGDARRIAQAPLHVVELVAVMHGDADWQPAAAGVLVGFVGDDDDLARALGQHLMRDARHGQHAVDRLAAGHRHRVVEQHLVGDIGLRRDRRADRQQARMEVGAVAQIDEHVLLVGEMHLAGPRHAFAAHLAEGVGIAVHPHRHVVAADAGQRARALGHARRRVVRAARAEPRLALDRQPRTGRVAFLGLDQRDARGDARAHVVGQIGLVEPARDRLGDDRRRQLVVRGQKPAAARHRPFAALVVPFVELAEHARADVVAPVVQLFLQRVLEDLPLFLDHQDLVEAGGELARVLRVERPHTADLHHANADARAGIVVQAQVGQRLPDIEIGLAGGHDAEARPRRIDDHAVQPVGAHIGQRRVPLVVQQPCLLRQRRIGPADIEPALGHREVLRQHDLDAVRIDVDGGARLDHVGDALHRHPQPRIAAHRPTVQAVVEVFLHGGRVQHRNAGGDQHVLGLVCDRRGLGGVVVAGQQQHAAMGRGAGGVGVLEHIDRAVDARALAVPHREHAVALRTGEQVDLLRAPDRGGRQVFVQPGLEHHVAARQMGLGLPQRLVEPAQRRAAVTGHIAGGIEPGGAVARFLQHRQAHQRLGAAQIDAAFLHGVLVVEADVGQRVGEGLLLRGRERAVHGGVSG